MSCDPSNEGAARLLAKAGVSFGMVEVKVVELKVFELVKGETQFPRNVCLPDREGIDRKSVV